MRSLQTILAEAFSLTDTEKALIASISIAPSPEMAYNEATGARNGVAAAEKLRRLGFITIDTENNTVHLTSRGRDILTSENLTDELGELTDRGQELVANFHDDKDEWKHFESFKYLKNPY